MHFLKSPDSLFQLLLSNYKEIIEFNESEWKSASSIQCLRGACFRLFSKFSHFSLSYFDIIDKVAIVEAFDELGISFIK